MSYETLHEYKRSAARERYTRILFAVASLGSAVYMWTVWQEISLIQNVVDGNFQATSAFKQAIFDNDKLKNYAFLGARALGAAAWISGLIWIYQVTVNARALSGTPLDTSPGWAVGSFFVPLFNLYLPFSSLREVTRASSPAADSSDGPLPLLWFFFVAYFVVVGVSRFLAREALTLQEVMFVDWLTLAAEACAIVTNLFFIALTLSLPSKQEKRRAEVIAQLQPTQS